MQNRHFQVKGILLKKINYKDSDRILTVFTDQLGKISLMAKGVRKPKSKLSGHLELFNTIALDLYKSESMQMYLLNSAEMLSLNQNYTQDLALMEAGFEILKKVNLCTQEQHALPRLFALLEKTLNLLNTQTSMQNLALSFQIKLFTILGFLPKFDICLACQQKPTETEHYFNFENRGINCQNCGTDKSSSQKITFQTIKILNFFQKGQLEDIVKLKLSSNDIEFLTKLINRLGEKILEN